MKLFKFRITYLRSRYEMVAQDESIYKGKDRMEAIINVVASDEQVARFYLDRIWRAYSWLDYNIEELILIEPIYLICQHLTLSLGQLMNEKVLAVVETS